MPSRSRLPRTLTLEEFLELPEEAPYLEYHDGKVERKVSPRAKHSLLTLRIGDFLNTAAEPGSVGLALPELRCTFGGRSIIPDIAFLLRDHIVLDDQGQPADDVTCAPDLHIEIISPKQAVRKAQRNLRHSLKHGCPLGWLVHPYQTFVQEYRPGQPVRVLAAEDVLDCDPVLPAVRLTVAELFGWLRLGPPPDAGAPRP